MRANGRLGNNLLQIANAILVARFCGYRYVRLPRLQMFDLPAPLPFEGLTLLPHGHPTKAFGSFIEDMYFFIPHLKDMGITQQTRREILRAAILPHMSLPDIPLAPPGQIAIHLRSGDIFAMKRPNPAYGQPPLSYYARVLRDGVATGEVTSALLVFEDRGNPCVDAVAALARDLGLPVEEQNATLPQDFVRLLGAQHLVFGRGTFGLAVGLLSDHARRVDVFDEPDLGYDTLIALDRTRHFTAREGSYIPRDGWQNTKAQRDLMLSHAEGDILEAP